MCLHHQARGKGRWCPYYRAQYTQPSGARVELHGSTGYTKK